MSPRPARRRVRGARLRRGATHFVSAYNLGAFALHAHKGQKGEVKVGMENAGGGARTRSESDNLKQGGKLADCETQSQRACRVPIRLVLQQIDEESAGEGGGVAGPAPRSAPSSSRSAARSCWSRRRRAARGEPHQKRRSKRSQ